MRADEVNRRIERLGGSRETWRRYLGRTGWDEQDIPRHGDP
jgi:hypothetical protein